MDDLEEVRERRRPEEEGVGVAEEGRQSAGERAVEAEAAAESERRPGFAAETEQLLFELIKIDVDDDEDERRGGMLLSSLVRGS